MENKNLIFAKISAIMADIDAIEKNNTNTGQGYKFRGIDDIYNALHNHFAKHGVFYTSDVLKQTREERPTKSGGVMIYTILKVKFTFYAVDGSNVSSIIVGEGSDSGDKSSNKAMSTALKYALMQLLLIPTKEEKDTEFQSPEFGAKQEVFKNLLTAESAKVIALEGKLITAKAQKPATLESIDSFLKLVHESEKLTAEQKINSIAWAKGGVFQNILDTKINELKI